MALVLACRGLGAWCRTSSAAATSVAVVLSPRLSLPLPFLVLACHDSLASGAAAFAAVHATAPIRIGKPPALLEAASDHRWRRYALSECPAHGGLDLGSGWPLVCGGVGLEDEDGGVKRRLTVPVPHSGEETW